MGNSSSKSSHGSHGSGSNRDAPPFHRSDTSNSNKSGRSIISRRSNRDSVYSNDGSSFRTAESPILSRKSSSKSVNNLLLQQQQQQQQQQQMSQYDHQISTQQQPLQDNNQELPPSMIQIPPREPILMRNYGENNDAHQNNINYNGLTLDANALTVPSQANSYVNTPITPTNSSFKSATSYGTPISPVDMKQELSTYTQLSGSNSPAISRVPTNSSHQAALQDAHQEAAQLPQLALAQQQEHQLDEKAQSQADQPELQSSPPPGAVPQLQQQREINIEDIIQRLLDAGYSGKRTKNVCLKNSEIAIVCATAREIFLSQPPLLELSPPVKIVGDVHGQFHDLIRIFTKCGFPPASNYLFLGDYVDRGKQSLETILLLLCYKIKYPENFFLLRGNHECASVTRVYGFLDECKRRCNTKTWKVFIDTFNTLPIAAIVASKIFCVHGGLSPVLSSMDEIRRIQRPTDIPDFGLLNDLVWSDPADTANEWEDNERGVSYCFNKIAINKFLNKFQFDLVVRAHMVVEDGYEFFNERSLVTVFSAPNYCGEFDNWGAVMSVNDELLCSFELLDPLDSAALKQVMKKGRMERSMYM